MWRSEFSKGVAMAAAILWSTAGLASASLTIAPSASTLAAIPRHASYPLPHPLRPTGTTVLYDQTADSEDGVPAQNLQASSDAFDAFAADDFAVTDVNGWTVSAFNFEVAFQDNGQLVGAPDGATYDVTVYADNARSIGAAVCSYSQLPGVYDASNTRLSVALPTSCVLPTGIYWLSLQVVADAPPQAFWLNAFSFNGIVTNFGNVAQWKNPGEGFASGCPDWTPISECSDADGNLIGSGIPNNLFQVVGFVNGNAGFDCTAAGICLQFTAAPANRDLPGLCGTATTLDVEAGDQVNLCYRVTNNTSAELPYQSLSDNVGGAGFTELDHPLSPGETWQYNRTVTIAASTTITAGWTAQDVLSTGYTVAVGITDAIFGDGFDGTGPASTSGFIDITTIGAPLHLFNEYSTANVTMPFSIAFYGRTSNLLCVGNSGDIQFGITYCQAFPNFALPYFNMDAAILSFWDRLFTHGEVYTAVIGEAPSRRFVVEWFQKDLVANPSDTDTVTFETILDEATGHITFAYLDTVFGDTAHDNGANATIGLQRNNSQADQYSYHQASVTGGTNIVWSNNVPTTYTGSATLQVSSSAAHAVVTPASIALSVPAGQSANAPLSIGNDGNRDLVWNLQDSASRAHLPIVSAFVVPMGDPAAFSGGRAPHVTGADVTNKRQAHTNGQTLGYPDVPSVAIDSISGTLKSFSAEQPRDWATVGPLGTSGLFTGGDFLDGDFSTLYALNYDYNWLFAVSTSDGSGTFIGTASGLPPSSISGLKQDPVSGVIYVSTLPPDSSGTSMLWTIDRTTAETQLVGPITNSIAIIDIAFNSLGQMYGIDIATDALVAIDKTTGQGSVVGSIGFNANYASGLAFDLKTDVLYFVTVEDFGGFNVFQEMWTVNTTTGAASLVSPVSMTPGEIQVDAFAIAHVSTACASSGDVPWLSYDVASGTTGAGQTSTVSVNVDTTGLDAGTHTATLCVYTNDASQRRVPVAVSVDVTAAAP